MVIGITKYLHSPRLWACVAVVGAILAQPYRVIVVNGKSMGSTYPTGSVHLVTKRHGPLQRGEVVVLTNNQGTLVKRIELLPGDRLTQIKIGKQWVDLLGIKLARTCHNPDRVRVVTVPAGQVYVLGDNRARSYDSRDFGPVSSDSIWGTLLDQKPFNKANASPWPEGDPHRHATS